MVSTCEDAIVEIEHLYAQRAALIAVVSKISHQTGVIAKSYEGIVEMERASHVKR